MFCSGAVYTILFWGKLVKELLLVSISVQRLTLDLDCPLGSGYTFLSVVVVVRIGFF
jgi:hypothetical protein